MVPDFGSALAISPTHQGSWCPHTAPRKACVHAGLTGLCLIVALPTLQAEVLPTDVSLVPTRTEEALAQPTQGTALPGARAQLQRHAMVSHSGTCQLQGWLPNGICDISYVCVQAHLLHAWA